MDKIVSLQKRIENKKQKDQLRQYRRKIQSIQKVTQCSSCHFRCAMCGLYLKPTDSTHHTHSSLPRNTFCENCKGEFEEFIAISKGEKQSELFWQNEEWMNMWSTWVNHRKAINRFIDSSEFKLLLEELGTQS